MGRNSLANFFFGSKKTAESLSHSNLDYVSNLWNVHPNIGKMELNKTMKNMNFLEKDLSAKQLETKNNVLPVKGVTLILNIGSSFFHILTINNKTGRTFTYLFDNSTTLSINSVKEKIGSTGLKVPIQKVHKIETSFTKINSGKRNSTIRLNIYREKCLCNKCLSASYIFVVTQGNELRTKLLRVLNSKHCRTWDFNWINILIEQSFIFFCCIKDGVIYERLLESASQCAKMLLLKTPRKDILLNIYSYLQFHKNFKISYSIEKAKVRETTVHSRNKKGYPLPFAGTGKEERQIIDGVPIVSFKTEMDMIEYTNLELHYMHNIKSPTPDFNIANKREIVPTKTTDITKIKGWRNKVFSSVSATKENKKDLKKNISSNDDHKKIDKNSEKKVVRVYEKRPTKILDKSNQTKNEQAYEQMKKLNLKDNGENLETKFEQTLNFIPDTLNEISSGKTIANYRKRNEKLLEQTPRVILERIVKVCERKIRKLPTYNKSSAGGVGGHSEVDDYPEQTPKIILEKIAEVCKRKIEKLSEQSKALNEKTNFTEKKRENNIKFINTKSSTQNTHETVCENSVKRVNEEIYLHNNNCEVGKKSPEEASNDSSISTNKMHPTPKDKIIIQDSKKDDGDELTKGKNSIFESDALDEFLKNNSNLNISYEIPTLYAAETINRTNNNMQEIIPKVHEIKTEQIEDDFLFREVVGVDVTNVKDEPNEDEGRLHSLVHVTDSYPKNEINPMNNKFIWMQGRPTQLLNESIDGTQPQQKIVRPLIPKSYSRKSKETQAEVRAKTEPEDFDEIDLKRPRLLTSVSEEEVDFVPKKFELPTDFGPSFIPIIHGCTPTGELSKNQECVCKTFSLLMTLNIGKGRHLSSEADENLETMNRNNNVISKRMATIAACAVSTTRDPKSNVISRIAVPVVTDKIIYSVKNWEQRLAYDKIAQTIPAPSANDVVDEEVLKVVNGLLDYAEIKCNPIDIPFDPMYVPSVESPKKIKKEKQSKPKSKIVRELRKLINVSIIDESNDSEQLKTESTCGNDFCIRGCLCHSLNCKFNLPLHCGKVSCLFECTCPYKDVYEQNVLKADQLSDTILAKEEMTWHQTIITSEDGDRIEVMNSVDKSKREKKLPTRFRNNVLLGKEMYPSSASPIVIPAKISTPYPSITQRSHDDGRFMLRNESMKKQTLKRRLGFCAGTFEGTRYLADVFIWCGIHDKYNCLCVSWVCRLKHNALIWKPDKSVRYLPYKVMTEMELTPDFSYEVYLYDPKRYCARTYGAPIEYNVRNRSETFLEKRKCEFENNVLSYTNSYLKMKFYMVKDKNVKYELKSETDEERKEVYKCSAVENVHIRLDLDFDEEIEVHDSTDQSVLAENIIVIPDDDTEESDREETKGKVKQKRRRRSSIPIGNDPNLIKTQMEGGKMTIKSKTPKTIKVPLRQLNKISKPTRQQTHSITHLQGKCENSVTYNKEAGIRKRPLEGEPFIIAERSDKIEFCTDNNETLIIKRNKVNNTTPEYDTLKSSHPFYFPTKDDVDTDLEGDLIKLDEHPMQKQLYGPDKLPKLALLCLTPGIGFLPILEFHSEVLTVQDPVFPEIYHSFKNLDAANNWLNRFFKNRLLFESIDTFLKWVIVKPGILKLKQSTPFTPTLLENPSIFVTKNGGLIFKKKDCITGGICRGAVRVDPLNLNINQAGASRDPIQLDSLRKSLPSGVSKETIVDICGGDGKRRKIQLETLPIQSEHILKRTINLYKHFPSMKQQPNFTRIPSTSPTIMNNIGNPSALCKLNTDNCDRKTPTFHGPQVLKQSPIRPFFVSSSPSAPLRVQVSSSGVTNLCTRTILPGRNMSPPPLALRSDVATPAISCVNSMMNGVALASSLISHDGRPVLLHKSTIIPYNAKGTQPFISKSKTP